MESPRDRIWEDQFLVWYSSLGAPITERKLGLKGFGYHQFATLIETIDGYRRPAHGRSQDRRTAAVKCAAEAIEREFAVRYFRTAPATVSAIDFTIEAGEIKLGEVSEVMKPPTGLRTSNGWAIHATEDKAKESAVMEALERHLLLKSFLKFGWSGFRLVQEIKNDEIQLFFLTSRISTAGYVAGIVAAHSPLYPGVAFGHAVGKMGDTAGFRFWECPIFEAIDKILSMNGKTIQVPNDPNAWIISEIKYYLENPFDFSLLAQGKELPQVEDSPPNGYLQTFDVAASRNLDFPLYAAFATGGSFIPLYHRSALEGDATRYLENILAANGISEIPEGHPIT